MVKKEKSKRQKKKGASVQTLLGIKSFTEYGLMTNGGEILYFHVTPTNISVLSAESVETRIRQLTLVLSEIPDIEIVCTDSSECFEDNKAYLLNRAKEEKNPKVKRIIKRDAEHLDEIQMELSTARQFLFSLRCKNMNAQQIFTEANRVEKLIAEQGFETHRLKKEELKRLFALYFDASLYGEQMPDADGSQYFEA